MNDYSNIYIVGQYRYKRRSGAIGGEVDHQSGDRLHCRASNWRLIPTSPERLRRATTGGGGRWCQLSTRRRLYIFTFHLRFPPVCSRSGLPCLPQQMGTLSSLRTRGAARNKPKAAWCAAVAAAVVTAVFGGFPVSTLAQTTGDAVKALRVCAIPTEG